MHSSFAGKIAVVTGVTSGIGEALTTRLIAEGMTVAGVARDPGRLAAVAERWGDAFWPILADLASPEMREQSIGELVARFPRVDLLVNNAAECVYETPLALEIERWRTLLEVNLLAAIALVQALAPALRGGGHVINLSSVTTRFLANARFAPYALTKAAVERFTEALRLELQPLGVKVSLLAPGLVDTPIYDKVSGFEKTRARLAEQVPTWLRAEDVVEAIIWMFGQPEHVLVSELVILPREQPR
jgi:3-hydroxy acid dehydrogenase/malonic semialdehyde reductase